MGTMTLFTKEGGVFESSTTRYLEKLEVEVADVVEEERVQGGRGPAEGVLLDLVVALDDGGVEAGQDEQVAFGHGRVRRQLLVDGLSGLEIGHVRDRETHGVPQLVAELAVAHDTLDIQIHVAPWE